MESVQNISSNYFQLCNKLLQNNLFFIKLPYFDDSLHLYILCINGLSSLRRHRKDATEKQKQGRGERNCFLVNVATHL